MAPPARYRPAEDVRRALEDARTRGLDFDAAWDEALASASFPQHCTDRREWLAVLDATRPEFEAAYEGRPTGFSRAYPVLALGLPVTDRKTEPRRRDDPRGRRRGLLVA